VNRGKLKFALDHNIAVYSSHLPLDLHPKLGNSVLLATALGLRKTVPFFEEKGSLIGRRARASWSREEVVRRVQAAVKGSVKLIPGGPQICRSMGIITRGASKELARARRRGSIRSSRAKESIGHIILPMISGST
jgi:putative NIF3 family GTP cyclohydrolase 1 type 2